ncbi:MAG TPA: class I SAM-dependent methyltransferase, partial [Anaerolineales bacterium]|nr:class I SAM-dependent methyltransferase [Anaerolineales bacterium]
MTQIDVKQLVEEAIASRSTLFDPRHESAFRLFNGFHEGYPDLTLDVYGRTLVIHNYADEPRGNKELIQEAIEHLQQTLDWLHAGIIKTRKGSTQQEKRGQLVFGEKIDRRIKEHGIWYAIDLTMNRDASFYLDTALLRKWLTENMESKSVLNTFAYTGSLGV